MLRILIVLHILQIYSVNYLGLCLTPKSLMKISNTIGAKTDTSGTPLITHLQVV